MAKDPQMKTNLDWPLFDQSTPNENKCEEYKCNSSRER